MPEGLRADEIEIDHNFSQAHRIVTTSILPLVEQYAENSRDVWEGAKVSIPLVPFGSSVYRARQETNEIVLETILRSKRQCVIIRI